MRADTRTLRDVPGEFPGAAKIASETLLGWSEVPQERTRTAQSGSWRRFHSSADAPKHGQGVFKAFCVVRIACGTLFVRFRRVAQKRQYAFRTIFCDTINGSHVCCSGCGVAAQKRENRITSSAKIAFRAVGDTLGRPSGNLGDAPESLGNALGRPWGRLGGPSGRSIKEVLPRFFQGPPRRSSKVSPRPPKASPRPPKASPRPSKASPR